ncbi:hypothetical protein H257_07896 [Aphanomyces astaci]|uniref:Uncharacterized protein n=1 Tax=Aphanomyces astaci TaxID=112090 RepID=W4GF57_APHAT|nr:hypothetical protein H257_07896 [Aphanomyces astaci]ETV78310.1 hypothetical protein H257_07896 [Aphanomyces astaci]|eukprot:XP_009831891.1 hypothetical protein H257_07896 [Aphanomyces astaci]
MFASYLSTAFHLHMATHHEASHPVRGTSHPVNHIHNPRTAAAGAIQLALCPGCLKVGLWSYERKSTRQMTRCRNVGSFSTRQLQEKSVCEASRQPALKRQRTQPMWSPNTDSTEDELTSDSDSDSDSTEVAERWKGKVDALHAPYASAT